MGFGRTIFRAVAGPTLIYWALMGHSMCRMWVQEPEKLEISQFPKTMAKADVDKLVKSRQIMVSDIKQAVAATKWKDFVSTHGTDDIEFEDFWMKWKGKEEFNLLLLWGEHAAEKVGFDIISENHGPDKIILEWVQIMDIKGIPWTLPVPMRVHVFLSKDAKGKERIYRYQEEWWFNKQINQETTFQPLGWLHEQLRRFMGVTLAAAVRNGIL